jgi:invasin B
MNNHITGSSSDPLAKNVTDSSIIAPEGTTTQQTAPASATREAIPSDFQVFEGTDILDRGESVTQEFLAAQLWGSKNKDIYQAAAQNPMLIIPDPEGMADIQPYPPESRVAIRNELKKRLEEKLRKKEGSGPELHLPQLEREANHIVNSFMKGNIGTLREDNKALVTEAAKETQEAWGLPDSWSIGPTPSDWTPIKEVDPPVNVDMARKEFLASNIEELLKAFEIAGQKTMEALPPNDPQRLAVGDLIRVIAQAIRDLKETLQQLQMQESDISIKLSKAKFNAIQERNEQIEEMHKKNKEIAEKRAEQEKIAKVMRIFAPIIGILTTIIGAILLPFTAGFSTALITAGIAVGIAMTAYTILDATLNVTEKITTAVNKWFESLVPGEEMAWARALMKAALVIIIVAALVAATILTGGGAAANAATQTASQIAKQAVLESIKQLSLQAIVITIATSNVFPELFVNILIQCGALNKDDEEGKMWAQIAMMVLTMFIVMTIVAKASEKGFKVAMQEIGKGVAEGAKSVGKTIADVATTMAKLLRSLADKGLASEELKQIIQALTRILNSLMNSMKNMPKDIGIGALSLVTDLKKDPLTNLLTMIRSAGLGVEVATGCIVGALGLQLHNLLKQAGEMEKAQELLKILIKLFDQLLNSFQEDLVKIAGWLKSLDQAMNSTFASANLILARASRIPA